MIFALLRCCMKSAILPVRDACWRVRHWGRSLRLRGCLR
jgi:hypothetical protein